MKLRRRLLMLVLTTALVSLGAGRGFAETEGGGSEKSWSGNGGSGSGSTGGSGGWSGGTSGGAKTETEDHPTDGHSWDGHDGGGTNNSANTENSDSEGGNSLGSKLSNSLNLLKKGRVLNQDEAQVAVAGGKAVSLTLVLTYVGIKYPGQVLDVKLRQVGSGLVYEVNYLANSVVLKSIYLDGKTLGQM